MMMFRATDTGGTDELRRLASRKFATARDKCGRTILHKAILNKKKDMIKFIVQSYKQIIDARDNVSSVHYQYYHIYSIGHTIETYRKKNAKTPWF